MKTSPKFKLFWLLQPYDHSSLIAETFYNLESKVNFTLTLYEARIRLEHNCPYTKFSKNAPQIVIQHWCSMESDVLEFSRIRNIQPSLLRREMSRLQASLGSKFVRIISIDPDLKIVIQKHEYRSMKSNINSFIEKYNCMEVQPTVYRDGFEWYRILAFEEADILKLFKALSRTADIDVISRGVLSDRSVGDTLTISMRSLFGNLTERQLKSLLTALRLGYYNTPRMIKTSDISKKLNTPRTTFETHLRKAEGKVLRGLIPYMELLLRAA
jgi:predicted DNA binding protein